MRVAIRVYADTSVYGGVFDQGIDAASRKFFDQVESGFFELVTSSVVADELASAPENVRNQFESFLPKAVLVPVEKKDLDLQAAYLKAGVVSGKWSADALHVALASTNRCKVIVSWNFRHIVHFDKIPLYNAVNLINGFDSLSINTPAEVISYEDEN
jgi:predicted nucleic acid-binding protein